MATKIDNPPAVVSLTRPSTDVRLAAPAAVVALGGRIPVLDGLRGIAILLVMVYHVWLFGTAFGQTRWERLYAHAAGVGWVGVDLFFVLSGFLITGILYDSRHNPHYYRVFYARRTVRIFPLYYAFLALFCGIVPFVLRLLHHPEFAPSYDTTTVKLFVWSYTLNWYEGLKGFSIVSRSLMHFWSLSVEEQFYFVWPFLVLTLTRRRLMGFCWGLIALAFAFRVALLRLELPDAAYVWTFSRADSLAIGAMVALAARNPLDWKMIVKWAPRLTLPALCGTAILLALEDLRSRFMSEQFFLSSLKYSLVGLLFGGCLAMAVCARQESLTHRSLNSPFLRFFGKYSYGLYIFHQPLIIVGAKIGLNSDKLTAILGNKFLAIVSLNAIAFALAIAIALASWNLFEKHFLKLKDLPFLRRVAER
jgi:peptidoglycan/LPS O-acetylase OafA/YrhL